MRKLLSISLAFVLLLSSSGIVYATHYCFGKKVKSGFVMDVQSFGCGLHIKKTDSCNTSDNIKNKSCCNNESVLLGAKAEFRTTSKVKVPFSQLVFVATYLYTLQNPFYGDLETYSWNPHYSPPIVKEDYQAFHQVYII